MVEMEAVRGSLLSSPAEMGLSQPQSRVGWLLGCWQRAGTASPWALQQRPEVWSNLESQDCSDLPVASGESPGLHSREAA